MRTPRPLPVLRAVALALAASVALVALPAAADDHLPASGTQPLRFRICQVEGPYEVCVDSVGVTHANLTRSSGWSFNTVVMQRMCVTFTELATGEVAEVNCHVLDAHHLVLDGQTQQATVFQSQYVLSNGETYCLTSRLVVVDGVVRLVVEEITPGC